MLELATEIRISPRLAQPRRSKLAPKKKVLLAEFSADLTQHLDRLFELNASSEASTTSTTLITTPSGPVRAVQPPLSSSQTDHSRALALRMFASDDSLCIGSHLTVLLDSIYTLKHESSTRHSGEAAASADRRRRRDNQPHRQVEMVRTVPLMYRLQAMPGGDTRAIANSFARPLVDVNNNSTDSDDSSSNSSDSSSGGERGAKSKARVSRRAKRPAGKKVRAPPTLLGAGSEDQSASIASSQLTRKTPVRRQSVIPNPPELKTAESRRSEPANGDGDDDEEEMKPLTRSESGSDQVNDGANNACSSVEMLGWHPRKLSSIPDDGDEDEEGGEEEEDTTSHEDVDDRDDDDHHHHEAEDGDKDADDEGDRRSYSFVQGELDHRDAVIAALRAENRAQAALIDQLQAENRRLRVEAACRGPANPLIASMSSTVLSTTLGTEALKLEQTRNMKAELECATDSELLVAKRSASVPFMAPGSTRGSDAAGASSATMAAVRMRRASAGRASATNAPVMPEEQVFEGLVQEIQEEFRCLLPAKAGAISSA